MEMREKVGYSADKFISEHKTSGLRDLFTCVVEGREIREDAGRAYVTMIRVKYANSGPIKGVSVRDSEVTRFFIPVDRISELELMVGDKLVCTGELSSQRHFQANLIANITTNIVYEAYRDSAK